MDDDTLKITGNKEPYKVPQITRTLPRNPVYMTLDDYANPFNTQADAGTAMIRELIDVIDNGAVSLNTPEKCQNRLRNLPGILFILKDRHCREASLDRRCRCACYSSGGTLNDPNESYQ